MYILDTMNEPEDFSALERQFGGYSFYIIRDDTVFGETFHPDLVEEDKNYEYEGKFDDFYPGSRLHRLGSLEDYTRYRKQLNS